MSNMFEPGHRSRFVRLRLANRGFALRDLLAIISMTAMLGTVCTAWLGILGQRQDGIVCLTNGRQMMRAFALYAQDYDGLLAGNEDNSGGVPQGHTWFSGNVRSLPNVTNQFVAGDPKVNVLAPYVRDLRIWKCPADTGDDPCGVGFANANCAKCGNEWRGGHGMQQLSREAIQKRNAWRRMVRGWTAIMDTPEGPGSEHLGGIVSLFFRPRRLCSSMNISTASMMDTSVTRVTRRRIQH